MPTKTKVRKKQQSKVWRDRFYVLAYELAGEGLRDTQIAEVLKVSYPSYCRWKERNKIFRWALKRGRKKLGGDNRGTLRNFIYGRLDKDLRQLWDKIDKWKNHPNAIQRIQGLFENKGESARKSLFLHALCDTHWNVSEACKRMCVPYNQVKGWVAKDFQFADLLNQVQFHRKEFCQGALMKLVKAGEPSAILFVNRTLNKDLGYSDALVVKHEGEIKHTATMEIKLDEKLLDLLTKSARKELFHALEVLNKEEIAKAEGGGPQLLLEHKKEK
jgi:hypothetical protein